MATFDVVDLNNSKTGSVELNDAIWAAQPRKYLLTEVVHWHRAKRRAGTHDTQQRADVNSTTKKPYKQKGTGNARQGDLKGPHMIGGMVALGPTPRSYAYKMPKAKRRAALATALSVRAKEGNLRIVKDFELGEIKTKTVVAALDKLGTAKALIVDGDNDNLKKSARNLADSRYIHLDGINVYDVLKYPGLVVTESAAKQIEAKLLGEEG
jgi:large subunit ribosomal protein L4